MKILSLLGGKWLVPGLLAAITTVYLWQALAIGAPISRGSVTASFFPLLLCVVMYAALGCAVLRDLRGGEAVERDAEEGEPAAGNAGVSAFGPFAIVVLTAGYIAAFSSLGYSLSTLVYAYLVMMVFGRSSRGAKAHLARLAIAVAITVLGYGLFELVFQVRLPTPWM
ncbi:tripartite tricarboxylate transporter TctB family protein [Halomonas sp. V046]|uniref:tripartite tricarboxylate transporter TctB family protein n=1 Tax=Halomonas sp. V046 TaxID=3459611 RepID=UPI004043CBB1